MHILSHSGLLTLPTLEGSLPTCWLSCFPMYLAFLSEVESLIPLFPVQPFTDRNPCLAAFKDRPTLGKVETVATLPVNKLARLFSLISDQTPVFSRFPLVQISQGMLFG